MSTSPVTTKTTRQPCEGPGCPDQSQQTFYCQWCRSSLCNVCWDRQAAHKPEKIEKYARGHEKIDLGLVERYREILEPQLSKTQQFELHKNDEETRWFGVGQNAAHEPEFNSYPRYTKLVVDGSSNVRDTRYPKLISFVGQTSELARNVH